MVLRGPVVHRGGGVGSIIKNPINIPMARLKITRVRFLGKISPLQRRRRRTGITAWRCGKERRETGLRIVRNIATDFL